MAATSPPLGEQLRERRTQKSLSLRELERRSGVNSGYLSQLERGEIAKPSPSVLQKVAKAYDVPFQIVMRWAGYVEDGLSPNAQKALSYLGDDFTEEELNALKAVLDVLRGRNSAAFSGVHCNDLVLDTSDRLEIRRHARGVLQELDSDTSDDPVDLEAALLVAELVRGGAIELSLAERRRLRKRFGELVDTVMRKLQGLVQLDTNEVFVNEDMHALRQRFVLAHEIGHKVLPDHRVTFAHLDDNTRLAPDFNDLLERQANEFSIELLAKGDRLNRQYDDSEPTTTAIKQLHHQYEISLYGTARRVAEGSRRRCAVAIVPRSREGGLLLNFMKIYRSESFERTLGWDSALPRDRVREAVRLLFVGGEVAPVETVDSRGRARQVTAHAIDTGYSFLVLLVCKPRSPLLPAARRRAPSKAA